MFSSNVTSDPLACHFCIGFSTINKDQNDSFINILLGDTSEELITWYDWDGVSDLFLIRSFGNKKTAEFVLRNRIGVEILKEYKTRSVETDRQIFVNFLCPLHKVLARSKSILEFYNLFPLSYSFLQKNIWQG